jgi:hypothetical protein
VKPDDDGVVRSQWKVGDHPIAHGPVTAVRAAATVVTQSAPSSPSPSTEALYEARFSAWARVIEESDEDAAENGEGALTASELAPWLAANLLERVDVAVAEAVAKMRAESGTLRRSLEVERERRTAERRKRSIEAAGMRKQVAELQAQNAKQAEAIEAMRTGLAAVERTAARDRSLRRLVEARRQYPAAQRADLERAKRRTDAALGQGP